MAKKKQDNQYNQNQYDSNYGDYSNYNNYYQDSNNFDLVFNKLVEVNNSGNQQIFNLISDVEGNLSNQISDIKSILINNRSSNNAPNSSFWPNYTIQQPPMVTNSTPLNVVEQPISQNVLENSMLNSNISILSTQLENLKREISGNKNLIHNLTNNSGLSNSDMAIIIDTNNKNTDQLFSALSYLENNIINFANDQANVNFNFQDWLELLREEIYANQNSLFEAISLNSSGLNNTTVRELYDEITKVNDENTQNLFNYLSDIETSLNNAIAQNNNDSNAIIHERISDLENRIYESNEISVNNSYGLIDRVDENSMVYHDLLDNLREELLASNYENFNEIMNVASQLRDELIENDFNTASSIVEHTNYLQEDSTNKLSYLNDQIDHIKQMLYNLNDLVGVNNDKFKDFNKNVFEDAKYRDELNHIKELILEKNRNANNNSQSQNDSKSLEDTINKLILKNMDQNFNNNLKNDEKTNLINMQNIDSNQKNQSNDNFVNSQNIEEVPWDDWYDGNDLEENYMDNYRNNSRKRTNRVDESKLDMIYDRIEQINFEINNKLYDLENNILNLIEDRDNQTDYKIIESNKMIEKLIFDSLEQISYENQENQENIRKEFFEKIIELREEFFEQNREMINEWDSILKSSMDEINTVSSNIIDEMINSQKRFDEIFEGIQVKVSSLEEELLNISENQMNIYGEDSNNFEKIYLALEKHKDDIKKTHLMWEDNIEKIESLKDKINKNSKELQKLSFNEDNKDFMSSLAKIDELKKESEILKNEINEIKFRNSEIENVLISEKDGMSEKINILYSDFHTLVESLDEKIQFDITNVSEDLIRKFEQTTGESSEILLDETSKRISLLESHIDENSMILEDKINNVNIEINDILNNLDNKINRETEEKLQNLYEETIELISNVQLQNENSRIEIEKTNNYLLNKIQESNAKIFELEDFISGPNGDERFQELSRRIDEMKGFNKESVEKIEYIYDSWINNNDKLKVLEEVLKNQSIEIQNLSEMSQTTFDDSYDKIKILYDNELKIKEEIHQIQSTNSLLESRLFEEKEILENKIDNVSSNIDLMINDLDTRVTQKTDDKIIQLYDETIRMIDQLKEENKNSFEEISLVNEGVSLNLFEVNSKITELEYISKTGYGSDVRFNDLYEIIDGIKNEITQSKEDVSFLIDSWKLNNEKISNLEKILEERSEQILNLSKGTEETFGDTYNKIEELYKSENSIKNEILSINAINEELEKKLLEEKRNLDEKIKILNEELVEKIASSEERIILSTDEKIHDLNTDLENKLITLHNEIMNLISELNESNQEMNKQISIIENDTAKSFYSIDEKMNEIANLYQGVSVNDPRYVELHDMILNLKDENDIQSKKILELQNKINKNIEKSKSLKKILVAQSEEIQFIATSSNDAIANSFDRIQELFNSEKNIKEEIEKIYEENSKLKLVLENEKNNLNDRLEIAINNFDEKINLSEEKFASRISDMYFELIEQINNIHYENVANVEKINNLEKLFDIEINENKNKFNELENLISVVPLDDPKFAEIFKEINLLKQLSSVSIERMQESYELININNEKISSLKDSLDIQGREITYLIEEYEGNFGSVYDRIQELYDFERNTKEEIEKIYIKNEKLKNDIFGESSKNNSLVNSETVKLLKEMVAEAGIDLLEKTDKKIDEKQKPITEKIDTITSDFNEKINLSEEKFASRISDMYFELIEQINNIHYENVANVEKINNLEKLFDIEINENKNKFNELERLISTVPVDDPKFVEIFKEINLLKQLSSVSIERMQESYELININNEKISSLKNNLDMQGREITYLIEEYEGNFGSVYDRIQELYDFERNTKEEIEKIYIKNEKLKNDILSESSKNSSLVNSETVKLLKEMVAEAGIDLLEQTDKKIENKIDEKQKPIIEKIDAITSDFDEKINLSEEKFTSRISDMYFELLEQINNIHYENVANVEKINNLEKLFDIEINENKNKFNELEKLISTVPADDPKFIEIFKEINLLKQLSNISIERMQESYELININNEKISSLKNSLENQGKEIEYLIQEYEGNFGSVYDRIQELYDFERNTKEEIEKIYIKNEKLKNDILNESSKNSSLVNSETVKLLKEMVAEAGIDLLEQTDKKIESITSDFDEKINLSEEKFTSRISDMYFELLEQINNIHYENVANVEKIDNLEKLFNAEIDENKNKFNELENLISVVPLDDPKFAEIFKEINLLKQLSNISIERMQENYDLININNEKISSLKDNLETQGKEIGYLIQEYEGNFSSVYDQIQELYDFERNTKEEIEKIYIKNEKLKNDILSESSKNSSLVNSKTVKLLKEMVAEAGIDLLEQTDKKIEDKIDEKQKPIIEKIDTITSDFDEKINLSEEKFTSRISDMYFELLEQINNIHYENVANVEKIDNLEKLFNVEINENKNKFNELENLISVVPSDDPKFAEIFKEINLLKQLSNISIERMQENYDLININNEKISSLKGNLETQGKEITYLIKEYEGNFGSVYDRIQELYDFERNTKEEIEKIYIKNEKLKNDILNESSKNDSLVNSETVKLLKEMVAEAGIDLLEQTDKKIDTITSDFDEKFNLSEEKFTSRISDMYFELLEQINNIHYENVANVEKIDNLEKLFNAEIDENKNKFNELENLISVVPLDDPKFAEIFKEINLLKQLSNISIEKMQENYDLININNEKISSLKDNLETQGKEITYLVKEYEGNFGSVYDRIQELYDFERNTKEEIEKIYIKNEKLKNDILSESSKNDSLVNSETVKLLKEMIAEAGIDLLEQTDKKIEDKIDEKEKIIIEKIDTITSDFDEKINLSEEKFTSRISDMYFELLEQINNIHYENVANVEKIDNLEKLFNAEIDENKNKFNELENLVSVIPLDDPKFIEFSKEINLLKQLSNVSIEKMQENHDLININNEKISSLKDSLDIHAEKIEYLTNQQEENYGNIYDRVQELYDSEKSIKEEIEKIYEINKKFQDVIFIESSKNKEIINSKTIELKEMIAELGVDILEQTNNKMNDFEIKIESLNKNISEMISEIEINSNVLFDEINNLDNYTRISLMTMDSKISEIDFLINQIPEEDPKFRIFINEMESLKKFNDCTSNELQQIHKSWKNNNKKLSSLEDILISQSEELRLLGSSNEEVWNLSFDRIQELFDSKLNIKSEIDKILNENIEIKNKFINEKNKLEEKISEINNNVLVEISKSKEDVLFEIDSKVNEINFNIEEKITQLYSEIIGITNEVHDFNEINSNQIVSLKDEVNSFVIDVNNRLFEINEIMNLLPEENPQFYDLFQKVDELRKDNDVSMYEIQKIYESWKNNNQKLISIEDILITQSEELKLLGSSNEEVWNLSFDKIQELFDKKSNITNEINEIFSETNLIKSKLESFREKIKDKIEDIDSNVKNKLSSLELDLSEKIDNEIANISSTINDQIDEKINILLNQTLELIENVRIANDMSTERFDEFSSSLRHELDLCNHNILYFEEKILNNLDYKNNDLENKLNEIKEFNVNVNNEIEKNKKLWLLNNFKLNSFKELLTTQTKEIEQINSEYEPSDELKRRIEDLLEIDQNLKYEIDEIIASNSKIEKNIINQKNNLFNKINDLLSSSKEDLGSKFSEKIDTIFNQSMEMINIVSESVQENKESIDIIHNLFNNNYELVNEKVQKLVEDVNNKFDKNIGLEKINELALMNDSISKEISRIQKDWTLNNEKLNSLEKIFKDELSNQKNSIDDINYTSTSLQENLIDLLELDGSINNEIEALKNKNLILEDNLFVFKKSFEDNIKEIINQIDIKIHSISQEKLFSNNENIKFVEDIVYKIVSREINNLPFKNELIKLSEEDNKIKLRVQEIFKKLSSKNFKINQMIFDEIWHCNLKIESLVNAIYKISKENSIEDIKKYISNSSIEIKKSYKDWLENNKKIIELEDSINKQNEIIQSLANDENKKEEIKDANEKIIEIKSEISNIEFNNNEINDKVNEIIKKQEISTETLYSEILGIINEIDVNLHKKIDEKLKDIKYPIDEKINNKEEMKSIILKYVEEIMTSEFNDFRKIFEENNKEINESYKAWLSSNQRISILEDIVIEHEKDIKDKSNFKKENKDVNLSNEEKDSINKLIANHKKRLI